MTTLTKDQIEAQLQLIHTLQEQELIHKYQSISLSNIDPASRRKLLTAMDLRHTQLTELASSRLVVSSEFIPGDLK